LPKVDVYDDQLFVVARTARLVGETIEYGETEIFRRPQPHHHRSPRLGAGPYRASRTTRKRPKLLMHGTDYLLHAVLD
jgi:magnesium transporter